MFGGEIHMKKSRAIIVIVICAVVFAALCTLGYFAYSTGGFGFISAPHSETVSLYFLDSSKTKLVSETRELVPKEGISTLESIVNMLIDGPADSVEKKRAIPENTSVLSFSLNGSIATVNFSGSFYGETDIDNSLAAATVVKTLCETNQVTKVIILVEGQELIGSDKVALGALGSDDIVYDGSQLQNNNVVISLYFADKSGQYLQLEKRTVKRNDKEPIEKIAITELMNGSQTDGVKLIPTEAKLISAEVKDGVCFVNFSKDFVDKHIAGSSAELLTIYSIVNTLADLDNVNKVQFLIEGQKAETFGEIVFDEPFVKNTSLIKQ